MSETFRAHHIICTSLYEGKGYSGAFCENMTAIVNRLRSNPDETMVLVAKPDMICANCPNRTEDGKCTENDNHVVEKDRFVMSRLKLQEGAVYSYRKMCRQARTYMTEEVFMENCGTCDWRAQGLCRYEDLIARLDACINASFD